MAMVLLGGLMVSKGFLRSLARGGGGVSLSSSVPGPVTSAIVTVAEGVVVDELAIALEVATCSGGSGALSNFIFAALSAAAAATNIDVVDDDAAGEDFLLFLLPPVPSEVAALSRSGVASLLVGWCLRMCSTNLSERMVPNWQLGTLHWYLSAFLSCCWECRRMFFTKLKDFPHTSHWCGFSLECVSWCWTRFCFLTVSKLQSKRRHERAGVKKRIEGADFFYRPGSLHLSVWPLCILRCRFSTEVCDVSNPHS